MDWPYLAVGALTVAAIWMWLVREIRVSRHEADTHDQREQSW